MKTKIIILTLTIGLIVCFVKNVYSADIAIHSKADDFDAIKAEISSLLEENKKLQIEHRLLAEEYSHIKELIKIRKIEMETTVKRATPLKQRYFYNSKNLVSKHKTLQDKQNELLIKQTKEKYLVGQKLDEGTYNSLWMLKLAELKNQKKSLNMELGLRKLKLEKTSGSKRKQLMDLQKQIQRNLNAIAAGEKDIDALQSKAVNLKTLTKKTKEENSLLEDNIAKETKELKIVKQENQLLKHKILYSQKYTESLFGNKNKEYVALKEIVHDLELQYKKLNEGISNTLSTEKTKRKYMTEVVKIDKDNQKLRDRIVSLKKQLEKLK